MASFKVSRNSEDIKRELTDIMRALKDPRISGLISVVKLDLSGDMSHCKVWISSMDGIEGAKQAVKGLTSASGYIRRELNLRLKLRKIPELHFIPDDSIEHSAEISKLLENL